MKEVQEKLAVKPDLKPKFCRARTVPYALHKAIEKLKILVDYSNLESLRVSSIVIGLCP